MRRQFIFASAARMPDSHQLTVAIVRKLREHGFRPLCNQKEVPEQVLDHHRVGAFYTGRVDGHNFTVHLCSGKCFAVAFPAYKDSFDPAQTRRDCIERVRSLLGQAPGDLGPEVHDWADLFAIWMEGGYSLEPTRRHRPYNSEVAAALNCRNPVNNPLLTIQGTHKCQRCGGRY